MESGRMVEVVSSATYFVLSSYTNSVEELEVKVVVVLLVCGAAVVVLLSSASSSGRPQLKSKPGSPMLLFICLMPFSPSFSRLFGG